MLQAGHVFSRVAHSTRWDEKNTFAQCASCNIKHEQNAWPFLRWYKDQFGQEALDELEKKYSRTNRKTDRELDEIYEKYRKLLNS